MSSLHPPTEPGDAVDQYHLGHSYANGENAPQDDTLAAVWYRKAAEQGLAVAQCDLGVCYVFGKGVPQSAHVAADWFHKAAMQGEVAAQYNLGSLYAAGMGLKKHLGAADGGEVRRPLAAVSAGENLWPRWPDDRPLDVGAVGWTNRCLYAPLEAWFEDELNGEPLTDAARRVTRLSGGSFVILSTSSVYNRVPDTYDGRHNTMSSDEFRAYIHRNADRNR